MNNTIAKKILSTMRRIHPAHIIFALTYLSFFLTPGIYLIKYTPPETKNLQKTTGTFGIDYKGRGISYYSITNSEGKIHFRCNGSYIVTSTCETRHRLKKYIGKTVTAHWDKRKVYPFVTQSHFFGLSLNKKIIDNPREEITRIQSSKKIEFVMLPLLLLLYIAIFTHIRNKQRTKQCH